MITHCEECENCTYIGEGDFVCDKYIQEPEKALVIEDWTPTKNFMLCTEVHKNGKAKK